jgi:glycosyltransferase involved in cell wall biosynthesis
MAKASAKLGYDVEVWAQLSPAGKEKPWPFRIRRLPLKGTHDLRCQVQLIRELISERRRLRYATVYLPEPGPMLAMMFLQFFRTFRPKKLILTFHGSEILRFYHNPLYRWLTRRLIRNSTRISTLTRYTQNLLCTCFPEAEDKVYLTPGALRSDFAVVHTPPPGTKGRIIILTVGRLHPRKGQLLTLRALQSLAPQFRERIEYWIVGSTGKGDYPEQLHAQVAQSDLVVRFFGDVKDDELDVIYDRADIFAMTSIDHGHSVEGFGLVYLEAAAHGLPVVGHEVGGVGEAVVNGETGLLVPPDRPAQLSAAFERLIADPALRKRMGDAGRTWAQRSHWAKSAEVLFLDNLNATNHAELQV